MKQINFLIKDKYNFSFEKEFKKIFKTFKKINNIHKNKYVDILITNNEEIRKISKTTRGINKPTDVLSFPFLNVNFLENKNVKMPLGEIVISYEKIEEQSRKLNHSLKREFCFMFSHCLYHLLGYDHKNSNEKEKEFNDKVYELIRIHKIKR